MADINQDLLYHDSRQAVLAPSVLLQLRCSNLDYPTYLQLVLQDVVQGLSQQEWGDQMESKGALTVAKTCWQAAGLDPITIEEKYLQSKDYWQKRITDAIQRDKQELQRCSEITINAEITQCELLLQEAEHFRDKDWYDLAEEVLERADGLLRSILSSQGEEKEQLLYNTQEGNSLLGEKPPGIRAPALGQPQETAEKVKSASPAMQYQLDPLALERQAQSKRLQQQANYHRTTSKNFKQAEQAFQEALLLWPGNEAAAKNYANMLRQQIRLNDAIKVLEEGAGYAQDRLPFYNLLTNYCTDAGLFDKARDYALRALRLVGDARAEIGVLTGLVTLEIKAGGFEDALKYIEAILRLNPRNEHMRKQKERLEAQLSGKGPTIVTSEIEKVAVELVDIPVEISPLIREDIELCEPTKVSPRILQSGDGALLIAEVERLSKEAEQLDRRLYRERAEYFLQAAKLLLEASKDGEGMDSQRLEQVLNIYTGTMGDYFFGSNKLDSARDYYLEHIRLYKRRLPRHTLIRVANYFQTFLPSEELRNQLADAVPQTSHNQGSPMATLRVIIEKMGQLADTANNPDQELARGLLELACVSELIASFIGKALETDEKMCNYLLPFLEILSNQPSVKLTSDELSDIFRQLVQYRHLSIKRQESQLNDLVASMGEKWSLEKAEEELAHFTAYQGEWSITDRTFFATVRDLVRRGHLYFFSEGDFSYREQLATSIIHDVDTFHHDLNEYPTLLGKAYYARIVYQLKRLVEKEFHELRKISLPRLVPSIVKAIWLKENVLRECHIDIANEGESAALDVKIRILSTEETNDYYQSNPQLYDIGAIYSHPHVRSVAIPVTLTKKAARQDAIDLLVQLEYLDRDNSKKATDIIRLRLPLHDKVQYSPIENPYRTGLPIVNSPMFVGRQELIEELGREMTRADRTSAVVIYGQKRSGKTSILRNLANHLAAEASDSLRVLPVYLSMQSTLGASDEDKSLIVPTMFYLIADEISQACLKIGLKEIDELSWERLIGPSSAATLQFRLYLDRIRRLPNTRLVLLIDEFTELSDKIDQGYVSPDIMKQLKSLIEQGFFSCVICGVDTMPDVLNKYANELAISDPRLVGYLSLEAARALIEEPTRLPDGTSRFASPRVVDDLIQLTAGSPYYIQFLCYRLIDYMNHKRSPTITGADVDHVVTDLVSGSGPGSLDPYTKFDNLTRYKDHEISDTRESVIEGLFLYLLADETRNRPYAPFQAILQRAPFIDATELLVIAERLEAHQVIMRSGGETARQYRIIVDLFRRWINAKRPMDAEMLNKFRRQLERVSV